MIINILPGSGDISKNIQTLEGGGVILITVYRSSILVGVSNDWLGSGLRSICNVIPEWIHETYQ